MPGAGAPGGQTGTPAAASAAAVDVAPELDDDGARGRLGQRWTSRAPSTRRSGRRSATTTASQPRARCRVAEALALDHAAPAAVRPRRMCSRNGLSQSTSSRLPRTATPASKSSFTAMGPR